MFENDRGLGNLFEAKNGHSVEPMTTHYRGVELYPSVSVAQMNVSRTCIQSHVASMIAQSGE